MSGEDVTAGIFLAVLTVIGLYRAFDIVRDGDPIRDDIWGKATLVLLGGGIVFCGLLSIASFTPGPVPDKDGILHVGKHHYRVTAVKEVKTWAPVVPEAKSPKPPAFSLPLDPARGLRQPSARDTEVSP